MSDAEKFVKLFLEDDKGTNKRPPKPSLVQQRFELAREVPIDGHPELLRLLRYRNVLMRAGASSDKLNELETLIKKLQKNCTAPKEHSTSGDPLVYAVEQAAMASKDYDFERIGTGLAVEGKQPHCVQEASNKEREKLSEKVIDDMKFLRPRKVAPMEKLRLPRHLHPIEEVPSPRDFFAVQSPFAVSSKDQSIQPPKAIISSPRESKFHYPSIQQFPMEKEIIGRGQSSGSNVLLLEEEKTKFKNQWPEASAASTVDRETAELKVQHDISPKKGEKDIACQSEGSMIGWSLQDELGTMNSANAIVEAVQSWKYGPKKDFECQPKLPIIEETLSVERASKFPNIDDKINALTEKTEGCTIKPLKECTCKAKVFKTRCLACDKIMKGRIFQCCETHPKVSLVEDNLYCPECYKDIRQLA